MFFKLTTSTPTRKIKCFNKISQIMPPKKLKIDPSCAKNTPKISDLFGKIQSKDLNLQKCDYCGIEVKSCLIKDHLDIKCTIRQEEKRKSLEDNSDVIVLESNQSVSKRIKIENEASLNTPVKQLVNIKNTVKTLSPFSIFKSNEEREFYIKTEETDDKLKRESEIDEEIQPPIKCKLPLNEFETQTSLKVNSITVKEETSAQKQPSIDNLNYSLNNFNKIIDTVLSDNFFPIVLNKDDHEIIESFKALSDHSKMLYVRLFQRKYQWINELNINYENIGVDMQTLLDELCEKNFLINESSLTSYEEVLSLLKLPQLKQLQKKFKLNTQVSSRKDIIKLLIEQSKNQKGLSFFKNNSNNHKAYYLKESKDLLGKCFKLQHSNRQVFIRVFMLYSLSSTHHLDQNSFDSGQQSLIQILMVNMGKLRYMNYNVDLSLNIFPNRNSFLEYQEALQYEFDLLDMLSNKKFEEAQETYDEKIEELINKINNSPFKLNHIQLPLYLRKFSSNSIYCKIISIYASEVMQRMRHYDKANRLFEFLLFDQKLYLLDSRARWYERLALNYETHLKNPIKAVEVLEKALKDKEYVRKAGRLNLYQRMVKMASIKKYQKIKEINKILQDLMKKEKYEIQEAPTLIIEGNILQPDIIPGRKVIFMQQTDDNLGNVCSVEQIAMSHYINNLNYTNGKHAETSTMHTIFGLIFWDILFEKVPNVFIDRFQSAPLDLQTDFFYTNRKDLIDSKIKQIRNDTIDDLITCMEKTWDKYLGTSGLVNWELFETFDELSSLIRCFKIEQLADLCDYMSKNYRYCRSGGPDLILWSTQTNSVIFVEVKGPGDKLSHKQLIWLDFFITSSIRCEVCYVKSSHTKRLRND